MYVTQNHIKINKAVPDTDRKTKTYAARLELVLKTFFAFFKEKKMKKV